MTKTERLLLPLEGLAYDFDVLCLQETRTRPEKPLELNDFIDIQKHEGRGMATVIHKGLQNTVELYQRCNNSLELQGIRLEKSDQRHKSLVLVNDQQFDRGSST